MTDYAEIALARGLSWLAETQAAIAHNLANVDSTGFKRRGPVADPLEHEFQSLLGAPLPSIRYRDALIWNAGPLRPTGERFHVTLGEDEFFRVRASDGAIYYTRAGELTSDSQGRLMTPSGYRYVGQSQEDVVIGRERTVGDVAISPNGMIVDAKDSSQVLGALGVFKLADRDALAPLGNGLYVDKKQQPVTAVPTDKVRQGFLELSNVDTLTELTAMIGVQRSFAATHGALTALNRMKRLHTQLLAQN
jgi:flagellar basal body rod protein FlgG